MRTATIESRLDDPILVRPMSSSITREQTAHATSCRRKYNIMLDYWSPWIRGPHVQRSSKLSIEKCDRVYVMGVPCVTYKLSCITAHHISLLSEDSIELPGIATITVEDCDPHFLTIFVSKNVTVHNSIGHDRLTGSMNLDVVLKPISNAAIFMLHNVHNACALMHACLIPISVTQIAQSSRDRAQCAMFTVSKWNTKWLHSLGLHALHKPLNIRPSLGPGGICLCHVPQVDMLRHSQRHRELQLKYMWLVSPITPPNVARNRIGHFASPCSCQLP